MKKIDIHCHATAFPEYAIKRPSGQRTPCAEELIEIFDKADVEYGVLLPMPSPECTFINTTCEETKSIVDKYPERFLWFCNIDPRQGKNDATSDLEYMVNFYKELGAKGLGEIMTQLPADDPMMDNLLGACERLDMPVLVHIATQFGGQYGIIDDLGLPRIERMLKKHPDLKFIGHSAAFWSEISGDNTNEVRNDYPTGKVKEGGKIVSFMREYKNVYCDISAGSGMNALTRDVEFTGKFLEEFSDRILYGTDVCLTGCENPCKHDEMLKGFVRDGYLSQKNYEKIIRLNAVKLLGLEK